MVNIEQQTSYRDSEEFVIWEKYEDIAMHFNGLLIRLRTQAVAGATTIVTLSGLAANLSAKSTGETPWDILCGTFVFLLLGWVAIWVIDMCYYNKLLLGAVEAIIEHEQKTEGRLVLAHRVEQQLDRPKAENAEPIQGNAVFGRWRQRVFYLLIALGLLGGAVFTGYKAITLSPATPQERFDVQVQRNENNASEAENEARP